MARDRSIALRVRAEVADAVRGLRDVAGAADRVGSSSDQAGRQSQSLGQQVVRSARDQSAAWTTVGSALTTYGAAVTGLGGLVLATGINYNSLRQTATAALTSVTGSTEEAAAQMQRLDDYGQNSWLMRDSLIRAQQQMTGFGISTERVVPYMDALSEAVAGTSASNEAFEELALVMGQIQSQGRITARELDRFGVRGIDAAQMIGDAMGMTADEIRTQITAGALDAETALDALSQGMMANFEGSSDLVRDTFDGAFNNVKASFRDLAALLASPLVDPEGGGFLVDILNWADDALRAFQGLPDPVLQVGGAIAGLTGPAALAAGGFLLLAPRVVATWDALGQLGRVGTTAQGALRGVGRFVAPLAKTLGVATAAFIALNTAVQLTGAADGTKNLDELQLALRGGVDDIELMGINTYSLDEAFQRLQQGNDLNDWFGTHLTGPLLGVHGDVRRLTDEFGLLGDELAVLHASNPDLAMQRFNDILSLTGATAEGMLDLMPAFALALEDSGSGAGDLADGLGEIDPEARAAAAAMEALHESLVGTSSGFVDTLGAWDAVIEKNTELAQSSVDAAGDSESSWEDFYDGHSVNISDYLDELESQVDAQRNWQANMTALAGRVSEGTLEHLARLGPEGAPLVAALVDASDEELDRFEDLMSQGSQDAGEAFATSLIEAIPLIREAMGSMSDEGIEEMVERLRNGETTIQDEIEQWDTDGLIDIPIDIDSEAAATEFAGLTAEWEGETATTGLDLDPTDAIHVFDEETGSWTTTMSTTLLDLDPDTAVRVFNTETGDWETTTSTTLLDLNPHLANQGFGGVTKTWGNTLTDTRLGANTSSASGSFNTLRSGWRGTTTNTRVGANTAPAMGAVSALQRWIAGRVATMTVTAKTIGPSLKGSRATGGPIHGVGTETSDSNLYALSVNEHVLSAREVRGLGGHGAVEELRAMARGASGLRAALNGPVRGFANGGTPAYRYMPQVAPVMQTAASGAQFHQTVQNYNVDMNHSEEVASATLWAMRRGARGSMYERAANA